VSSLALAGIGLDSMVEFSASTVVLWELSGTGKAVMLIGVGFAVLSLYIAVQAVITLVSGLQPRSKRRLSRILATPGCALRLTRPLNCRHRPGPLVLA